MTEQKTKLPTYRHHKASGQGVVTLSGRDHYLGPWKSKAGRREYDRLVAEWLARGRRAVAQTAASLSVNELLQTYLEWAEGHYREHDGKPKANELFHVCRALRPLREGFGLTPAADFGPRKLAIVRDRFVREGLARSMCNRYVRRIKHAFKLAVAKELIEASVWHGLNAVDNLKLGHTEAHETEPIRPVQDHFVDAVRPFVSRQVWGMVELQRRSGCRPGEAVAIRAADLDMTGRLWVWKPSHHKTAHHGHHRVVMLGPKAQAVIRPFLQTDLEGFLFSPAEADDARRAALSTARTTPLSCGNRPGSNRRRRPRKRPGDRYSVDSYRRAIHYGCDRADIEAKRFKGLPLDADRIIPRWAPNQLRHGFATRVRREFGLDAAQVSLGHKQAAITELYAERDQRLAAQVAAKIG